MRAWRDQTPEHFLFAWKASKFITHWKRLTPKCRNSIELMESRLEALSPKVGAVLFQLPPRFQKNRERLARFLDMLPAGYRYAFEFRHPGWYDPAVFKVLEANNCSLCISDHHHAPAPFDVTADFVYLRGHGPGGRYYGRYGEQALRAWAAHIRRWRKEGRRVFCYFDGNDAVIVWTHERLGQPTHRDVLVIAREGGSDHPALTRWWRPWHHEIGKAT